MRKIVCDGCLKERQEDIYGDISDTEPEWFDVRRNEVVQYDDDDERTVINEAVRLEFCSPECVSKYMAENQFN